MTDTNFFSKFSINTPNKYVLYLAGISFVLSLVFPIHGLEVKDIQKGCLVFIGTGLLNWILVSVVIRTRFAILTDEAEQNRHMSSSAKEEIAFWTFLEFFVFIVSYLIAMANVFG